MVYDRFLGRDDDGGLLFGDTSTGATLKAAPTPEALERAQVLSGGTLTGLGPLPGADGLTMPASADLGTEVMRARQEEQARILAGEGAQGASGGERDPSGAGGAPQGGPMPSAEGAGGSMGEAGGAPQGGYDPGRGKADQPPPPSARLQGAPGPLRFSGSRQEAPNLWAMARDEQLRALRGGGGGGAPVRIVETPTGKQIMSDGAPSPETMARLEGVVRGEEKLSQRQLREEEAQKQREAGWLKERTEVEARQDAAAARLEAAYRERQETITARREQLDAELDEGKIDPNQFWGKMPVANKAMALIGVMLGAKAAGSKGTNEALGILERAIDRDIDAQKANLAKKQWQAAELGRRYQQNRELMQDERAARLETKAAAIRTFDAQIKQRALASGSEQALINAEKISLQADKRIAELHMEADARIKKSASFGYRQVGGGGGGGGASARVSAYVKAAELDERARKAGGGDSETFTLGGATFRFKKGLSDGEKAKVRERALSIDSAKENMGVVRKKLADSMTNGTAPDSELEASIQGFTYDYMISKGQSQATEGNEASIRKKLTGLGAKGGSDVLDRELESIQGKIVQQYAELDVWPKNPQRLRPKRCTTKTVKPWRSPFRRWPRRTNRGSLALPKGNRSSFNEAATLSLLTEKQPANSLTPP